MYYQQKTRQLLSKYLPKKPISEKIICKDEELKEKIVEIFKIIDKKINVDQDWTIEDYYDFKFGLANMEIKDFNATYNEIVMFLNLSKKELEQRITELDKKSETGVFNDERIIIQIVDPKTKVKSSEYKMIPHVFNVGDLINYLSNLISKINRYNNFIIDYYNNSSKQITDINKKQEYLQILIEMLINNDPEILGIIEKEYSKWASPIYEDEIIGVFIKRMLPIIIPNNVERLKNEAIKLEIAKNEPYTDYANESRRQYVINKIKGV